MVFFVVCVAVGEYYALPDIRPMNVSVSRQLADLLEVCGAFVSGAFVAVPAGPTKHDLLQQLFMLRVIFSVDICAVISI